MNSKRQISIDYLLFYKNFQKLNVTSLGTTDKLIFLNPTSRSLNKKRCAVNCELTYKSTVNAIFALKQKNILKNNKMELFEIAFDD